MNRIAYVFLGLVSVFLVGQALPPVSSWSGPSSSQLSAFGIPLSVTETSDQHLTFAYNLNTEMVTTAVTGTGNAVDTGAAITGATWCLHAHLLSLAGTGGPTVTLKVQDSADNISFADVTGMTFTAVTAGPGVQRIATASNQTVRRYLRAVTTTSGGFTSATFAVAVARNDVSTVF